METYQGMKATISFSDGTVLDTVLSKPLSCGGYKCAINMLEDVVLMLPLSVIDSNDIVRQKKWDSIVDYEVEMSELLTNTGLLNPYHKRVKVDLENTSYKSYVSRNFRSMEKEGIYVIESKFFERDTDDKHRVRYVDNVRLFRDDSIDKNNMKSWEPILIPFIDDILMIHKHKIKLSEDSTNYALVRRNDVSVVSPYIFRYFGFDFSPRSRNDNVDHEGRCWNSEDINDFYDMKGIYDKVFLDGVKLLMSIVSINENGVSKLVYGFTYSTMLNEEKNTLVESIVEHFESILKERYIAFSDPNCEIPEEDY